MCPFLRPQCRDEYLAMGMLHMTNAVSFLNNDCKLVSVATSVGPAFKRALGC